MGGRHARNSAAETAANASRDLERRWWPTTSGPLAEDLRRVLSGLARSRLFAGALAVLLTADLVLIVLHILHELRSMGLLGDQQLLRNPLLLLSQDRGYGELWGYAKALAVTAVFIVLAWKRRAPIFGALAFTFAVIVLDDSLMLHEVYGYRLAAALALEPRFGLEAQDFGELLVWSGLGVLVAAALLYGFWRSDRQSRALAAIFLGLLAALVLFAVGVDMLHIALSDAFRGAHRLWPLIEEGGELVVLSLACAAAVALSAAKS